MLRISNQRDLNPPVIFSFNAIFRTTGNEICFDVSLVFMHVELPRKSACVLTHSRVNYKLEHIYFHHHIHHFVRLVTD